MRTADVLPIAHEVESEHLFHERAHGLVVHGVERIGIAGGEEGERQESIWVVVGEACGQNGSPRGGGSEVEYQKREENTKTDQSCPTAMALSTFSASRIDDICSHGAVLVHDLVCGTVRATISKHIGSDGRRSLRIGAQGSACANHGRWRGNHGGAGW